MDHHVAPAGHGLVWFQQAIRMLDRDPRRLIQVAAVYALLEFLPSLLAAIPTLAQVLGVVLALLGPALTAGLLYAISEADAGRPVESAQLFEGLRRPGVRRQLLILGVFMLIEVLLMRLSVQRILGPGNIKVLMQLGNQQIAPDNPALQAALVPMLKAMMAATAVLLFLLTGLFFAIPRVMFDGRGALAAIFESFYVCAGNIMPLIVYVALMIAASFGLGIGLTLVGALLGALGQVGVVVFQVVVLFVIVIGLLVSSSGNYLAWRGVFGRPGTGAPPPPQTGIIV